MTVAVWQDEKTKRAATAAAAAEVNDTPESLKSIAGELLTVIHNPLQGLF